MTDAAYTQTRFAAAERLRTLGHALVAHRPPTAVLEQVIDLVDDLIPEVEASPTRPTSHALPAEPDVRRGLMVGDLSTLPLPAGRTGMFDDSIVSGLANPMSIAATYHYDGEETVGHVVLGPAFEGAPGRAHGGVIAALFDETMGAVLPTIGTLAYTGSLNITYRAPSPIGETLEFRARIVGREGRRINIDATATAAGTVVADATAVFIAADFVHADTAPESTSE